MIEVYTFESEYLSNERDIYIFLPPSYGESEENYPVFYMQDGQNIFSEYGEGPWRWNMDETALELIEKDLIEEIIIVGIANTEWRDEEYTPSVDENEGSGGYGDLYLSFLIDEVKSYIDDTFRVRPFREDTAIGGSSLGGLLSLYAAMEHPEYFGKIAAMSPSIWWDYQIILTMAEEWEVDPEDMKIWLDMGVHEKDEEDEIDPVEESDILCEILKSKGFKRGKNLRYYKDYRGEHNEFFWGKRMGKVLKFLFGK